ncbi:hypothetical protein D0C36_10725 [Mucilaginibacter conchicola]|uniref:Uncharacterized protein n=1 Tax=Mucilaginibacter conchicola TaxID=2303333 RepID=A0A372NRN6_9SPHI|nr:glycerol-3-phosphate dehydrogenase/oxidase [Mucilaginibacter conchicola]RFZ91915.1 hypothetical protein D0C36_10725 [Mucilaginibacter conchicola]
MNTADKHYKCINSQTGYAISYTSLSTKLSPEKVEEELNKLRAQVATKNGINQDTVYWEEIKDEV